MAVKLARFAQNNLPKAIFYNRYNAWVKGRQIPKIAPKSFKEIYKEMKI